MLSSLSIRKRPKKYICPLQSCSKAYDRPSLLQQHRRSHANDRPFACPEPGCDKRFFRNSHLQVHRFTHSDKKPLKCCICHRGFTTNQQLSRHLNTHKLEFDCPYICGSHFRSGDDMSTHILENHISSEVLLPPFSDTLADGTDNIASTSPSLLGREAFGPEFFSDLHCKEPECIGVDAYESISHLTEHYDNFHSFIPPGLFQ